MCQDRQCFVCPRTDGLHEHHAVPRAYGGGTPLPGYPDGFTLPLCGGCHTLVHALADGYWATGEVDLAQLPEDRVQKEHILRLVYLIYQSRSRAEGIPKPIKFATTLSTARGQRLKELCVLLGCSQKAAVDTAIDRLHQSLTMKSSASLPNPKAVGA